MHHIAHLSNNSRNKFSFIKSYPKYLDNELEFDAAKDLFLSNLYV